MRLLLQWIAVLVLTCINFVPAYLGMHFTRYLEYLGLTLLCAGTVLVVMRFVNKAIPLEPTGADTDKESR